jgi:pyruvate dehydrogenase E1 component alpha subunit
MSAGDGASARARGYGVEAVEVDGNDVEAVHDAAGRLIATIRAESRPALLHARTYRFKGHVSVDPAAYRDPKEVAQALQRDPLERCRARLLASGTSAQACDDIMTAARDEVAQAVTSAINAPWPDSASAFEDIQDTGAGQWL